jgi:hypothetical protein
MGDYRGTRTAAELDRTKAVGGGLVELPQRQILKVIEPTTFSGVGLRLVASGRIVEKI